MKDPNTLKAPEVKPNTPAMRVGVGDPDNKDIKTKGVKMRGTGAAIKGITSRGPMA